MALAGIAGVFGSRGSFFPAMHAAFWKKSIWYFRSNQP